MAPQPDEIGQPRPYGRIEAVYFEPEGVSYFHCHVVSVSVIVALSSLCLNCAGTGRKALYFTRVVPYAGLLHRWLPV